MDDIYVTFDSCFSINLISDIYSGKKLSVVPEHVSVVIMHLMDYTV